MSVKVMTAVFDRYPNGGGAERVNDFATPSVMNLLCRAVDCGWGVSPEVAG